MNPLCPTHDKLIQRAQNATAKISRCRHRALRQPFGVTRSRFDGRQLLAPSITSPHRDLQGFELQSDPVTTHRHVPHPSSQPAIGSAPVTGARVHRAIPCTSTALHPYHSRRFHGDGVDDLPAQAKNPSGDSCCHGSLISEASRTPVVQGSATVGYPFSTSCY